mgnify:CR=1 FL=1
MLEIQGLSKKYGDYLAVDHVSFTVPTGKIEFCWDQTEQENLRLSKVLQVCSGMKVESEFRKWKHIAWRRKRFSPMFRNCRQCSMH